MSAIVLSSEIAKALDTGPPVVALESSVISQGLPHPHNLEAAQGMEGAIRSAGATPATIAVLDGCIRVGLTALELRRLACSRRIEKAGVRDLGHAVATGATMATTVGATIRVANVTGIRVMATGGVGGVHRGADQTFDISHDLHALATTPVVTVCSGFKSILDLPKTLEVVETLGIPLAGFRTAALPDFYSVDSGFGIARIDHPCQVWRMMEAQEELGVRTGLIVANPPPADRALQREELASMIADAQCSAAGAKISGKAVTPYLLEQLARRSEGRTVQINVALLHANAQAAAEIACARPADGLRAEHT